MNKEELLKAADLLEKFGAEIAQAGQISPENADIITELAKRSVPIAKLIEKQAFALLGLDSATQPIVLNAITGAPVTPCTQGDTSCTIEPIDIPTEIQNALDVTQPMDGKVLKNGQQIQAKYIVSVAALYPGSTCITYFVNGEQYVFCW